METKYVIVEAGAMGTRSAILFPDWVGHDEVVKNFGADVFFGAGFCSMNMDGKLSVYGNSQSLKVSAKEQDAKIINTQHKRLAQERRTTSREDALVRELQRAERLMTFKILGKMGAESIPFQDDVLKPIRELLKRLDP